MIILRAVTMLAMRSIFGHLVSDLETCTRNGMVHVVRS